LDLLQISQKNLSQLVTEASLSAICANLPDPDVIAAEIVEDRQAALDEFALNAADLRR